MEGEPVAGRHRAKGPDPVTRPVIQVPHFPSLPLCIPKGEPAHPPRLAAGDKEPVHGVLVTIPHLPEGGCPEDLQPAPAAFPTALILQFPSESSERALRT